MEECDKKENGNIQGQMKRISVDSKQCDRSLNFKNIQQHKKISLGYKRSLNNEFHSRIPVRICVSIDFTHTTHLVVS